MANEKRLIWDEDAKRHLIALAIGHHSEMLHIDMILNAILHHVPTVEAVEVVHGRWIEDYDTFVQDNGYESEPIHTGFVCSVCGRHSFAIEPYCHCGAKMDGDGNG